MPISYRDYRHPHDEAAQEKLRLIPLVPQIVQLQMKLFKEDLLHAYYMTHMVRLGPKQFPEIYRHVVTASRILNIPVPEVYLKQDPEMNAFAIGYAERNFLVLHSALLETVDDNELRFVIAHECGHIACQHSLYRILSGILATGGANILTQMGIPLGPLKAGLMAIEVALFHFMRMAELSADRAGALVMREARPAVESAARMCGASKSFASGVDVDLLVAQAEAYEELQESNLMRLLLFWQGRLESHPFPVLRAKEIIRWCETEEFKELVRRAEEEEAQAGPVCDRCGAPVKAGWRFCGGCGSRLETIHPATAQVAAP